MAGAGFRVAWEARPWTLRLYVGASFVLFVYSMVTDPQALAFFSIVAMAVFSTLLWNLWKGERAMWWLFLLVTGAGAATAVTVAFDEPVAWISFAVCIAGLFLLVAEPTQAFVRRQSGKRVP